MSRFVVRFMKDVLGENGRQAEICQCTVPVVTDAVKTASLLLQMVSSPGSIVISGVARIGAEAVAELEHPLRVMSTFSSTVPEVPAV